MNWPSYVPAAVRAYIETLIDGDQPEQGWAASLTIAKQQLSEIEQEIAARTGRGQSDLASLRQQKTDTTQHRNMLQNNVDCLLRLGHDHRMREPYALLTREVSDDTQWRGFIYSAWAARMDYASYRERLKRARELKEEIADAADKLGKVLRQFFETGVNGPGEFYSVRELLRKTDNHELQGRNLYMWRSMRKHVLGDPRRQEPAPDQQYKLDLPLSESDRVIESAGVRIYLPHFPLVPSGDRAEPDPLADLHYGWTVSPPVSDVVETLSTVARGFDLSEYGTVAAAIDSRKANVRTDYVRAFAHLLTDVHHFTLTTAVRQAMAIVANVVLNLLNSDVTYDDVRKALEHSKQK